MSNRDIKDCVPLLQEFWPKLKLDYENQFPGRELFLTCTLRSVKEQQEIYAKNKPGHILTRCDGIKNPSNHNPLPNQPLSRAFDVAVKDNGIVKWEESYYYPLALAIEALGYKDKVRSGGWFSFRDWPHIEAV